jgi:hypothetical protein
VPESSSRNKKASKQKPVEKTPKKPRTTSRRWVAPLMLGCWLLGLIWLVVFYVAGPDIPYMRDLGNWNFAIGFALMIAGLLMTMRWK